MSKIYVAEEQFGGDVLPCGDEEIKSKRFRIKTANVDTCFVIAHGWSYSTFLDFVDSEGAIIARFGNAVYWGDDE